MAGGREAASAQSLKNNSSALEPTEAFKLSQSSLGGCLRIWESVLSHRYYWLNTMCINTLCVGTQTWPRVNGGKTLIRT